MCLFTTLPYSVYSFLYLLYVRRWKGKVQDKQHYVYILVNVHTYNHLYT